MPEHYVTDLPVMQGNKITQQIERLLGLLSKHWVVIAAAFYACGYVTVSIYHASLGLNHVDALSPQVAAAGLLFFVLLSVAAYLLAYSRRVILGFGNSIENRPRLASVILFGVCFTYVFDFLAISVVQKLFHFEGVQPHPHAFAIAVALGTLFFWVVVFCHNMHFAPAWIFHWVTQFCCALYLAGVAYMSYPQTGQFGIRQAAWSLALLQFMFVGAVNLAVNEGLRRDQNWLFFAGEWLVPLLVYGVYIYPHVRGEYGGGEPTPANITLVPPTGSNSCAKHFAVQIVDETTNGFYIMDQGMTRVRFIPRAQVFSIEFNQPRGLWASIDK